MGSIHEYRPYTEGEVKKIELLRAAWWLLPLLVAALGFGYEMISKTSVAASLISFIALAVAIMVVTAKGIVIAADQYNVDLRVLSAAKLEDLQKIAAEDDNVRMAVSRWLNSGYTLRNRDFEFCKDWVNGVNENRTRAAVLDALRTNE